MKKMRKFAWIFMAAMTVAGFSACSNSEDEDLPGTGCLLYTSPSPRD